MKHLKSLLSLVLTIVFIASLAVVPAFAAGEKIVGDCKLYLPNEGGIQVAYKLTDASGVAIAEPAYAITEVVATASQTAVAAADMYKYAQINAEGALSVSQLAKGHTITITATAGAVEASHQVEVSDFKYFFDFEDETVGQPVANPNFEVTNGATATVVAENGGKAVHADYTSDNNKHPAHLASPFHINMNQFSSQNFTIEGKVDTFLKSFSWGSINAGRFAVLLYDQPGDNYGAFNTEDKYFFAAAEGNDATNEFWAAVKCNTTYDSYTATSSVKSTGQLIAGSTYYPFALNVINNQKFNLTLDGKNCFNNGNLDYYGTVMGDELSRIAFFANIDDIEIYTGTKISEDIFAVAPQPPVEDNPTDEAGNALKGDAKLYMPNEGIVKVNYQAVDVDGAAIEGVAYSLEGENVADYAAINPVTGELYIKASATGKSFKVNADAAGGIALSKNVTVNATKYYFDFEDEEVGSTVANPNFANGNLATVVAENGGKAVHADYSSDSSHPAHFNAAFNLNLKEENFTSQNYTIEGKVDPFLKQFSWGSMAMGRFAGLVYDDGNGTLHAEDKYFAAFVEGSDAEFYFNAAVKSSDQSATGRRPREEDYSQGQAIAGTDYYPFVLNVKNHQTFSLTLNGENNMGANCMMDGSVMGDKLSIISFFANIDDIELYSGTKVTETIIIGGVEVLGEALNTEIPVAAGEQTVSFGLARYENPGASDLIIAHYNADGKLVKAERAAVTASNKIVSMTDTFAEGDYVKGFYWKWSTVQPIR